MLDVLVITAHQCLFEGKANQVILPGESGVFEVLNFHRPIISTLLAGYIVIDDQSISIERGVAKVERNAVTLIVDPTEEGVGG